MKNNAKIDLLHDKSLNTYYLTINDNYKIAIEKKDFDEIAYLLNINIEDKTNTKLPEQKVIFKCYDGERIEKNYCASDSDIKLLCRLYLETCYDVEEIEVYRNSRLTCKLNR